MRTLLPYPLAVFFLAGLYSDSCLSAPSRACTPHLAHYEKHYQIPSGLLQAMAKIESGRKTQTRHVIAWPWTINVEGKGYYFRTKAEAIAAVRLMQAKGIKSIDVGCMQVNLFHHPTAFKNLEEAFDPQKNIAYAAFFLKGLKNEHKSWATAVAHYHSSNPVYHRPYQKNVFVAWSQNQEIAPPPFKRYRYRQGLSSPKVILAVHQSPIAGDKPLEVRKVTRAMLKRVRY